MKPYIKFLMPLLFAQNSLAQVTLTAPINKLLSDTGIEFAPPADYTSVGVEKNTQMNYDFAIKSNTIGLEVRFAIRPDKNATGENDAGNMAVAMNVSGDKNPAALRTNAFPPASVKKEFNANAGGIYFLQNADKVFSKTYTSCLMMYLNKKGVGDIYAFLLFDEMNEPAVKATLYSIKFVDVNEQLMQAVKNKDLAKVKDLLAKGGDPNTRDGINQSLLQKVVPTNGTETAQEIELMKALLDAGANPNFTSNLGSTSLHTAAYYGLTKIVQLLLDKGADPTIISTIGEGNTPIKMALNNSKPEMAKMLETKAATFPSIPIIGMDSKLTYGVDFGGQQYKFIMDIVQDEPEIVINWKMTTGRGDKAGNISMSSEAVQSATAQYNLFENGEIVLDDKTSVWVSRSVFKSLRTGSETVMNAMGEDKIFVRQNVPPGTEVLVDGKAISVIYAEATDGSEKFWILNNPKMPLILKMDLGWKIGIEKIESAP